IVYSFFFFLNFSNEKLLQSLILLKFTMNSFEGTNLTANSSSPLLENTTKFTSNTSNISNTSNKSYASNNNIEQTNKYYNSYQLSNSDIKINTNFDNFNL